MDVIKSWDSLAMVKLDIDKAIAAHNAALATLKRNGAPIYSPEIQREHEVAAREKLTTELNQCRERAAAFHARAEAAVTAGRDDPYSWLSEAELQRAALLRPFIAEDVAATSAIDMTRYTSQVATGRRKLDRATAWLLMREVERVHDLPVETFERLAMPEAIATAEAEAQEAQRLVSRIGDVRPERMEQLHQNILRQANFNATGQLVGQ